MLALAATGCMTTPTAAPLVTGSQATVVGTIASIDTQPWTYDGNAVVLIDSAGQGRSPEGSLAARTSPGAAADLRLDELRSRWEAL